MAKKSTHSSVPFTLLLGVVFILCAAYFYAPSYFITTYTTPEVITPEIKNIEIVAPSPRVVVRHIKTPEQVKAIYMTSWVAGTPRLRERLVALIDETEINAVVIDIKDDTGRISFDVVDQKLKEIGSADIRISDLEEFIDRLHEKNIYVIGRVAVFQDPYLVRKRPELAVLRESDKTVWKDKKGLTWLDAGSKEVWDYVILVGKEAYSHGFDEINYDYIRFPSDGNMQDIFYPFSETKLKSEVIKEFFVYLSTHIKPEVPVISADLFGMTTTAEGDMNIGQILENTFPYFDYVAPMVYPSHYPRGFNGYSNPAAVPYEVVHFAMASGVNRAKRASTTPNKLRPWLQDFDLGADYTADMVRKQIQATYDVGLDSWMMWNASNVYTREAFNVVDGGENE